MNLITTDALNAAIFTMRFYSDKMDKRSLTEPEFMAWQKMCRFVEAVFEAASTHVMVDGKPVKAQEDDLPAIEERASVPTPMNVGHKPTLLMQFAQYCLAEDLDSIPSIARKSLFPKGDFVPVHLLYATLKDHLYRNYTPNDLVIEYDKNTHELRFTWRGETVEVKREKPAEPVSK
jgi:hypothetical protein